MFQLPLELFIANKYSYNNSMEELKLKYQSRLRRLNQFNKSLQETIKKLKKQVDIVKEIDVNNFDSLNETEKN